MQITLPKENLLKGVSIANRFIPLRPSLPVVGNILFLADKGELVLKATNLEASLQIHLPARSTTSWEITAPAKIVNEFIGAATAKEVNLDVEKENLVLNTDQAKGELAGINASEFPPLPEEKNVGSEFEQEVLAEAVSAISFAASTDEGKPMLTGILLREEGEQTLLVATDGYRLAKKTLDKKYGFSEAVVPAKVFSEAVKIAGEMEEELIKISLNREENQLLVSGKSFQVASRLLDGTYPAFGQIIPDNFVAQINAEKEELLAAVRTTAVFARDLGNVVHFKVGKGVEITASTAQLGQGATRLNAKADGESLEVAFNSHFLLDGLNAIKENQVEIKFSGALSPTLIKGKGDKSFIYVIMPVKVQK